MKHKFLNACGVLSVAICISSCTTTGDPTQGGLLGWSEKKAIQRSDELSRQKHELELMLNQNQSQLASSKKKLHRLNQQIATRKTQVGTSDTEYKNLVRQRDQLASEIRSYEQDMQGSPSDLPLGI